MKHLKRKKQTFWGLGVLLLGLGPLSAIDYVQTYLYNQAGLVVGNKPSSITVTDFNGDGRLDLAVTNQSDNTVSVILGGLDGSFAPQVDYQVGTAPVALVNGDFNGDHIPDLAVINSQDNTVSFAHAHGP